MKKSRFFPVFKSTNPVRYSDAATKALDIKKGVYIIKEDGVIVYIGSSLTNIYRTFTRHFQKWDDGQYRTTYQGKIKSKTYTVRVVKGLRTDAQVLNLEKALVFKYQPRDNKFKLDLFNYKGDVKKIVDFYVNEYLEAPF
jgi:excinuclease UvrABC nuclease subunit